MEDSVIYDLLLMEKLGPYREELEKKEDGFKKMADEEREKLKTTLNEEQLELVDKYVHSLNLHEENVNFQVESRALNFGIKIGVQLQKSIKDLYRYFDEENDYE